MNALQHRAKRQRHVPAQPFRQQRRLVKPALALFRRMQRNGNDRIETAFAKTFVVERGHQPARDQMAKMNLASVFKIENDVANDSAASESRNRGVEMEDAMGAVGAGKGGGNCAIKRHGTFRAKRRHNSATFASHSPQRYSPRSTDAEQIVQDGG